LHCPDMSSGDYRIYVISEGALHFSKKIFYRNTVGAVCGWRTRFSSFSF